MERLDAFQADQAAALKRPKTRVELQLDRIEEMLKAFRPL